MNKKGFTLIELLAVIVVLAVIAIIATPMVLNTIEEAREGAAVESVNAILSAAETKYVSGMITGNQVSRYDFPESNLEYKGTRPEEGTIIIDKNGNTSITAKINGYCVRKRFGKNKPEIIDVENCTIENSELEAATNYSEAILNGADPVISGNLVAVSIDSTGVVTKANRKQAWYSYENKNWANAVVLFGEDTYAEGDTIEESAIKQYYVWIPRYKYQLWNVNSEALYPNGTEGESAINIVFESKNTTPSTGDENGEWLTHPAFTSFDTNGIWVGKYETSYNEETYTNPETFLTTNPNYTVATNGANMIIKPNVRSLTNKNVSEFYTMSREVNSELNSHMMKNTEWGAVAYLTYSNYGKCTDVTCEEVYKNNISTGYHNKTQQFAEQWQTGATITGCSTQDNSETASSNDKVCKIGYAWNEINNKASTTGNISGIYDMSGGNWEYLMAVIADSNGSAVSGINSKDNSGFNGIFGCPTCDSDTSGLIELTTGIDFPTDARYYDLYESDYDLSTDVWYDYTNGKLGDATKEIAATKTNSSGGDSGLWYADYADIITMSKPFFLRGGGFNFGIYNGIVAFGRSGGQAASSHSSRLVLAF